MANIPIAQAKIGGTALTATAATAGPDTFVHGDNVIVMVHNRSAGTTTVTIAVPGNTKYGLANPDIVSAAIPAAGHHVFGPFPVDLADPNDFLVDVTAAPFATVDWFAVRV